MGTWSTADFKSALNEINFPDESKIFVHSSLGMVGRHDEGKPSAGILDCFETLAEKGIRVYLPAFTYSLPEGQVFDPRSDVGLTHMGSLSVESFSRGYFRTVDPIFSVLTNDSLFSRHQIGVLSASFGPKSLFSSLVDSNVWVLNIGTGVGTTLLHEIERRLEVPYRFDREYEGDYLDFDGITHVCNSWRSYVRDLEFKGSEADFGALNRLSRQEKFISRIKFGKTEITSYQINDMADFIKRRLVQSPNLLNMKGKEDSRLT